MIQVAECIIIRKTAGRKVNAAVFGLAVTRFELHKQGEAIHISHTYRSLFSYFLS